MQFEIAKIKSIAIYKIFSREEKELKVNHYIDEKILEIELTEEIDHHSSEKIRTRLDYEIRKIYA